MIKIKIYTITALFSSIIFTSCNKGQSFTKSKANLVFQKITVQKTQNQIPWEVKSDKTGYLEKKILEYNNIISKHNFTRDKLNRIVLGGTHLTNIFSSLGIRFFGGTKDFDSHGDFTQNIVDLKSIDNAKNKYIKIADSGLLLKSTFDGIKNKTSLYTRNFLIKNKNFNLQPNSYEISLDRTEDYFAILETFGKKLGDINKVKSIYYNYKINSDDIDEKIKKTPNRSKKIIFVSVIPWKNKEGFILSYANDKPIFHSINKQFSLGWNLENNIKNINSVQTNSKDLKTISIDTILETGADQLVLNFRTYNIDWDDKISRKIMENKKIVEHQKKHSNFKIKRFVDLEGVEIKSETIWKHLINSILSN